MLSNALGVKSRWLVPTNGREAGMGVSPRHITALAMLVIAAPLSGTLTGGALAADLPAYKPPSRGAPSARVGGGTRSMVPPQQIWALAPDHTGLTTREQPTLYWYLTKPTATHLELRAAGDQAVKPLLELTIPSPSSPGVQKLDLARHGIRLQAGAEYRFSVTVESDPRQRSSSGRIQRVDPSPALAKRLEGTPKAAHVAAYAEEGIWYDAIGSISELIEQSPADAELRKQRESLLEQIGLKEAAAGDARR